MLLCHALEFVLPRLPTTEVALLVAPPVAPATPPIAAPTGPPARKPVAAPTIMPSGLNPIVFLVLLGVVAVGVEILLERWHGGRLLGLGLLLGRGQRRGGNRRGHGAQALELVELRAGLAQVRDQGV